MAVIVLVGLKLFVLNAWGRAIAPQAEDPGTAGCRVISGALCSRSAIDLVR